MLYDSNYQVKRPKKQMDKPHLLSQGTSEFAVQKSSQI